MSVLEKCLFQRDILFFSGDFRGKVTVNYNVFTVFEGDSFDMTCSATHEDKRPELRWYFVDIASKRFNLTNFSNSGRGKCAVFWVFD